MRWIIMATVAVIFGVLTNSQFLDLQSLDKNLKADRIVIYKSQRKMVLLNQYKTIKTYRISLSVNPQGTKTPEGNNHTPEGTYRIDRRNAKSDFYLSLHLSYPKTQNRKQALAGVATPAGSIMIHGIKNGFGLLGLVHHLWDWTEGNIAVTNGQIREIWHAVPDGTVVDIRA